MSDTDSLELESEHLVVRKVKLHYDTQSSYSSDSSQELNDVRKGRQQRYRKQNREKLKQSEAKRRRRKKDLQIIAEPSTSSNINRIEINNEKINDANSQSLPEFEGTQTSSHQENEQAEKKKARQKKTERQQRYREQNREKLKQLEAERRKLQNNSEIIVESSIDCIEIICEPIIGDEISTNSLSVAGLENTQNLNNEQIRDANSQRLSGLEGTQTLFIQENKQTEEKNALQKKRERQQRYREQNREKLRQRDVERRKRLKNLEIMAESSSASSIDCKEIFCEVIIDDEISTNSLSVPGLGNTQNTKNEEITVDNSQKLTGVGRTQTLSIQEYELAIKKIALQKKRERQQRYREQNREKLKQREAKRRKLKQLEAERRNLKNYRRIIYLFEDNLYRNDSEVMNEE